MWKTTDAGQVWTPIFDAEHVASIGAIAVSQSNPKIVYVGTGEQTWGNGIYKSTDAGATWTNVGLRDTRFVGEVLVDPVNPDVVLVAAIGDLRNQAPAAEMSRFNTTERGVFKSTDGGRTWTKTLFKEEAGGSASMVWAVDNPKIVYATLAPAPAARTPFDRLRAGGWCGGGRPSGARPCAERDDLQVRRSRQHVGAGWRQRIAAVVFWPPGRGDRGGHAGTPDLHQHPRRPLPLRRRRRDVGTMDDRSADRRHRRDRRPEGSRRACT